MRLSLGGALAGADGAVARSLPGRAPASGRPVGGVCVMFGPGLGLGPVGVTAEGVAGDD